MNINQTIKATGKVLFGSAVYKSFQVTSNTHQHVDKVILSDCESIPSENNYMADDAKNTSSHYDGQGLLMHQRNVAQNGGACKGYMSAYNPAVSQQGYLDTMGNQSIGAIVSIGNEIQDTEENDPMLSIITEFNFKTDGSLTRQAPNQIYNKKPSKKKQDSTQKTSKQCVVRKLKISLVESTAGNNTSSLIGKQSNDNKKPTCQTPSSIIQQAQKIIISKDTNMHNLKKTQRFLGQQVRQIQLNEEESENSLNDDIDEHHEAYKKSPTQAGKPKPKKLAKPNKPLISYSKALPVKKIELANISAMHIRSDVRLTNTNLMNWSTENTPNTQNTQSAGFVSTVFQQKKRSTQDIKIVNVQKFVNNRVNHATGLVTRRTHTSTSNVPPMYANKLIKDNNSNKDKEQVQQQASKIPITQCLKPSPMTMKSMKFQQLQQKSISNIKKDHFEFQPIQSNKRESFASTTPKRQIHILATISSQNPESNISQTQDYRKEMHGRVNSIKNIQDLYCKTHTHSPIRQSEQSSPRQKTDSKFLEQSFKHQSQITKNELQIPQKLNQSSSAKSLICTQQIELPNSSPYVDQTRAEQANNVRQLANRRMDSIINNNTDSKIPYTIGKHTKIVKSVNVKVQGIKQGQPSKPMSNFQESTLQMANRRDNKFLKTIISIHNEEDESHESKILHSKQMAEKLNKFQAHSRTNSLTIQGSLKRITSIKSLNKQEQNVSPIAKFKPSFNIKSTTPTNNLTARRGKRSYSYINNQTVEDNKTSLERILGPNQASRLFDTLERVLKTNNVKGLSLPRNLIENSKSVVQINQDHLSRNGIRISPINTQSNIKTIDLTKNNKSNSNLHSFRQMSKNNQSPKPPIGFLNHRREISSPECQHQICSVFKEDTKAILTQVKQNTYRGISNTPRQRLSNMVKRGEQNIQFKSFVKRAETKINITDTKKYRKVVTNPNTSRHETTNQLASFGTFQKKMSNQDGVNDDYSSQMSVHKLGSTNLRKFNSGTKSLKDFILKQKKELYKARAVIGEESKQDSTIVLCKDNENQNKKINQQSPNFKEEPKYNQSPNFKEEIKYNQSPNFKEEIKYNQSPNFKQEIKLKQMSAHRSQKSNEILIQVKGDKNDEIINDGIIDTLEDDIYLKTNPPQVTHFNQISNSSRRKRQLRKTETIFTNQDRQGVTFAEPQRNVKHSISKFDINMNQQSESHLRMSDINQVYTQTQMTKQKYRNQQQNPMVNNMRESINTTAGYTSSFFKKEKYIEQKLQNILQKNKLRQQEFEEQDKQPESSNQTTNSRRKVKEVVVDKIDLSKHTMRSKNLARERTEQIYFKKEELKEEEDKKQQDSIFIYDNNDEPMANYMEFQPQSSRDFADIKELQDEIDRFIGNLNTRPDKPEIPQNVLDELKAEIEAEQRAVFNQSQIAQNFSPSRFSAMTQDQIDTSQQQSPGMGHQQNQSPLQSPHEPQYMYPQNFSGVGQQQFQFPQYQPQYNGMIGSPSHPQVNQFDHRQMQSVMIPSMQHSGFANNPMMNMNQQQMAQYHSPPQMNGQHQQQFMLVPVDPQGRPILQGYGPQPIIVQNQMQYDSHASPPYGMNTHLQMYQQSSPRRHAQQQSHDGHMIMQNNFNSQNTQTSQNGNNQMHHMQNDIFRNPTQIINHDHHTMGQNQVNLVQQDQRQNDATPYPSQRYSINSRFQNA